jgi:hypothetical protein
MIRSPGLTADPRAADAEAVVALTRHPDAEVRRIAGELLAALGMENGSTRRSAAIARRDALLRKIRLPTGRLARELAHYRGTAWLRDRDRATNPYSAANVQANFWRVLKLVDRDIGRRQLERILRHPGSGNVAANGRSRV